MIIPAQLRDELLALIEKGDEAAARAFVIDHLKEFPQESQDAIIMSLVEEAVAQKSADEDLVHEYRAEGMAAADQLNKLKHDVDVAAQAAEIKGQ